MKKILIVDDEPDVNLSLKIVLENNGFKVDTFDDSLLALQNFREQAGLYDLIIFDIKMPKMSGYELYKEIRKIDDKIKVCFFTASEAYHEEFRKSVPASVWNEDCYIQKPINNKELIKRINNIITTSSC